MRRRCASAEAGSGTLRPKSPRGSADRLCGLSVDGLTGLLPERAGMLRCRWSASLRRSASDCSDGLAGLLSERAGELRCRRSASLRRSASDCSTGSLTSGVGRVTPGATGELSITRAAGATYACGTKPRSLETLWLAVHQPVGSVSPGRRRSSSSRSNESPAKARRADIQLTSVCRL